MEDDCYTPFIATLNSEARKVINLKVNIKRRRVRHQSVCLTSFFNQLATVCLSLLHQFIARGCSKLDNKFTGIRDTEDVTMHQTERRTWF
ncbi:hypothetical protein PGTUg99_001900 [Puccinia graminis f. sp. tritici]|uniref:Uncharacterized protein n=1 Tax=Puccinia graminis f. sp. tritici TaxID=56615 RepID=A0A5B0NSV0_PUCGR|nr:hypothetical protein PGTUg99_001900 [Puccinia graminis f. sp. tritici]